MIDRKYGFILDQTIEFEKQNSIIEAMKYQGEDHPLIHGPDQPTCMKILHVRTFNTNHINAYQFDAPKTNNFDHHDYDDFIYINRTNPDVDWHWIDNPIVDLVRPEVEKLSDIYEFITRVTVLVTDINASVPFHREWMYGNTYKEKKLAPHQFFQRKGMLLDEYEFRINHRLHQDQGYYACKIPITTIEGNNGNSYFKFDNDVLARYGAGNRMFCINEIEMRHGALPSTFLRGVIYIDGKIKLDKLNDHFYSEFQELQDGILQGVPRNFSEY